jgi:hypothetical protein
MILHAQDPAGKAAFEARPFAEALDRELLRASLTSATREERGAAYERAAFAYAALTRRMTVVETAAPAAFRAGYEQHQRALDHIEHQGRNT